MTFEWRDPVYADMIDNGPMLELYVANAARTGRTLVDPSGASHPVVGSTDMGNVSYVVPSIHPMIKVGPAHVSIHSQEFAEHTAAADGDAAVVDGAKALAMTVVDLWLRPDMLEAAKNEFAESVRTRSN
jgi:metal-dependent amidase/aminoacylase/carboxypeptidase family protein